MKGHSQYISLWLPLGECDCSTYIHLMLLCHFSIFDNKHVTLVAIKFKHNYFKEGSVCIQLFPV